MRVSNIHPTFSERRANYDNDSNKDCHDHDQDNDNYDSPMIVGWLVLVIINRYEPWFMDKE